MFRVTQVLHKGGNPGLLWKQNAWGQTRKRNAKDLRKRIENVEAKLRLPYTTASPLTKSTTQKISLEEAAKSLTMQRINQLQAKAVNVEELDVLKLRQ